MVDKPFVTRPMCDTARVTVQMQFCECLFYYSMTTDFTLMVYVTLKVEF